MDLGLTDKVAVVTGASKGIGLAVTKTLVGEGAYVVAGAHTTDSLDGLDRVIAVPVDLAAPDGPGLLVQRAIDEHGRIDTLVNNVGAVRIRVDGFLATSDDEFEWAPALLNLSKSLAQEFGSKGIHVNCVSPGPVGTDLWLGDHGVAATVAAATGVDADTARQTVIEGFATERFTTPEEVATLVALLASERTANVTGANYVIDGGLIKTT
jgi:NAD(P)-dependent dehydrogenase (short-subunit alcohol dehydrogenase family)